MFAKLIYAVEYHMNFYLTKVLQFKLKVLLTYTETRTLVLVLLKYFNKLSMESNLIKESHKIIIAVF